MKHLINDFLRKSLGYEISRAYRFESDSTLAAFEKEIYSEIKSRTMTNPSSISNILLASEYLTKENVPGAYVECGVWRGGSAIAFCIGTLRKNLQQREVYLYDTFEGYLATSEEDFQIQDGKFFHELYKKDKNYLCEANLNDVKTGMESSEYPANLVTYVVGDVLETIPKTLPRSIALLRLDTDYFDSTLHELTHLFPLVEPGGVIIIDDYDHWNGSKKACDEYFKSINENVFLMRMESGRMFIKRGS
jgi:hypothetical protein